MNVSKKYPDLIEKISEILSNGSQQFTPKQSRMVADAVFQTIINFMAEEPVKKIMTPIGVLSLRNRDSYKMKHPKTGKEILVEEKTLIEFRPSNDMIRSLKKRSDTYMESGVYKRRLEDENVQ